MVEEINSQLEQALETASMAGEDLSTAFNENNRHGLRVELHETEGLKDGPPFRTWVVTRPTEEEITFSEQFNGGPTTRTVTQLIPICEGGLNDIAIFAQSTNRVSEPEDQVEVVPISSTVDQEKIVDRVIIRKAIPPIYLLYRSN